MTQLTRTGQPVQGTRLEIHLADKDEWEACTVVGKMWGKGGSANLVGIIVEWDDGHRQGLYWDGLVWRETGD